VNNIRYQQISDHIKQLQIVTLVTTGRTGSDFFQSLLDGHPQILQLPGHWFFHEFWDASLCKGNLSDLINEFIWFRGQTFHYFKFKSVYHVTERMHELGPSKNESFEVSTIDFHEHMMKLMKILPLDAKNFFLAIHAAYALANQMDISQSKMIFYHIHHIDKLERFSIDFKNFSTICTIRDPRNTIISGIENWKKFNVNTYTPMHLYFILERNIKESTDIYKFTNNIFTLRLEDLHKKGRDVLNHFCQYYGLDFNQSMMQSTFMGKLWWGDQISGKYLNEFNPSIDLEKWHGKITHLELVVFEFLIKPRLEHNQYSLSSNYPKMLLLFLIPLALLLPMKYEIKILRFNLHKNKHNLFRIKCFLQSIIYYLLRLKLYYTQFAKVVKEDIKMTKILGHGYQNEFNN
jgi:hypothetical protein